MLFVFPLLEHAILDSCSISHFDIVIALHAHHLFYHIHHWLHCQQSTVCCFIHAHVYMYTWTYHSTCVCVCVCVLQCDCCSVMQTWTLIWNYNTYLTELCSLRKLSLEVINLFKLGARLSQHERRIPSYDVMITGFPSADPCVAGSSALSKLVIKV